MRINKSKSSRCCGQAQFILNLAVDGRFFLCHNIAKEIGTIEDEPVDLLRNAAKFDNATEIFKETGCYDCKYFRGCKNCLSVSDKSRKEYYCKLVKATLEPIMPLIDTEEEK